MVCINCLGAVHRGCCSSSIHRNLPPSACL